MYTVENNKSEWPTPTPLAIVTERYYFSNSYENVICIFYIVVENDISRLSERFMPDKRRKRVNKFVAHGGVVAFSVIENIGIPWCGNYRVVTENTIYVSVLDIKGTRRVCTRVVKIYFWCYVRSTYGRKRSRIPI